MKNLKGLAPALVVAVGMAVYAISPTHHQLFCSGAMFSAPVHVPPSEVP